MAHFARLNENKIVTMVAVVSNGDMTDENGNEVEALGVAVCESVIGPGRWIQTSYNGNFRKQYAGIGFTYNEEADVFISVSPYPSWIINSDYDWEAPIPYPPDGKVYVWNEESISWALVETSVPKDQQTTVVSLP